MALNGFIGCVASAQGQQTPGPGVSLKVLDLYRLDSSRAPDHPGWVSQAAEVSRIVTGSPGRMRSLRKREHPREHSRRCFTS